MCTWRFRVWGMTTLVLVAMVAATFAGKGGGKKPPPDDPPENPAIAYSAGSGSGEALYVANGDGSNERVLLTASSIGRPSWSPDASSLVFASDIQGNGIYTIGVDGTGLTKIADLNWRYGGGPAWSPVKTADGEFKIAFYDRAAQGAAGTDIFLVNPDGSGLQNLTNTPGLYESVPAWAPSATRLVINEQVSEDIVVHDVDLVDGELAIVASLNLTSDTDVPGGLLNGTDPSNPNWAKTQDKIIVTVAGAPGLNHGSDLGDLWVIDLDDPANPVNVTNTPDSEERFATYSPDDLSVAFLKNGRKAGIYVMDADGLGRMSRILNRYGPPDWRRDP